MKTWTKPGVSTVDAGFEVTRYLPSTLDLAAKRACRRRGSAVLSTNLMLMALCDGRHSHAFGGNS